MNKINKFEFLFLLVLLTVPTLYARTVSPDSVSADIVTIKSRLNTEYLKSTRSSAATYLANQDTSGMWKDVNYADTNRTNWTPITHLTRINAMSVAYKTPADASYLSANMLNGIKKGLLYWYSRKPVSLNWYQNQIAQQRQLMPIMIMLENDLKGAILDTGIAYLLDPTQVAASVTTGDNLFSFATEQLVRGSLRNNDSDVVKASNYFQNEIRISNVDGSIQADFSFHQHGAQLYNGGYGLEFLGTGTYFAAILLNTKYGFAASKITMLSDFLLNGTRLMIRGKLLDYGAIERGITRKGGSANATGVQDECTRLATFIPSNAALYNDLYSHTAGTGKTYSYIGNKHFWCSDFMTHQRAGYYTSVKMVSSRTKGTEVVNYENLKGYWLPFGSTFICKTGTEYLDIFPVWDWARIPGVTGPHSSVIPGLPSTQNQPNTFVGGASDGMYGAAALSFNKLSTTGNKGYFYFDEEFVALGAGITSTHADTINTTINQCLLTGNTIVDGVTTSAGIYSLSSASWILHNNVGYVFPDKPKTNLSITTQKGTWKSINDQYTADTISLGVFQLYLNHGYKPINASYQYIVLPVTTQSRVQAYALSPAVRILSNKTSVQAVRHDSLKVTEAIFYAADSVTINSGYVISADKPCVAVINESGDSLKIALSDPSVTNTLINITLRVDGVKAVIPFTLPTGFYGGSSVIKTIKTILTEIPKNKYLPLQFELAQNYPNPFNPSTIINYTVPVENRVSLMVYDILGKEVRSLVSQVQKAGSYSVRFDGTGLPSGLYFYQLKSGDFLKTNEMILIK